MAAISFLFIPWMATFLAKFVTGAFTGRYAITAILEVSILITWAISRISSQSLIAGLLIFIGCLGWFLIIFVRTHTQAVANAK
jgi:hypothetical protein